MKILIVAKTRRGAGACVGGITETGQSVRLIAHDAASNERAGLEYEVGEVWEIDAMPAPNIVPPHEENIIVLGARRLRLSQKVAEAIRRFMPPVLGGPEKLFDGLTQATSWGRLYITQRTGLPHRSTMFWAPDQALRLDCESKRLHYRYPTSDGGRTLTYVGFQEPVPEIPCGTLVRVSLAHWWRPTERPTEELRCYVQLSGWVLETAAGSREALGKEAVPTVAVASAPVAITAPAATLQQRALQVLRQTFGLPQFLPLQSEVIVRILQHQDALVVMPTGSGKSLCYQLPGLIFEGLTVIVSPLVALMQDQVSQLDAMGVAAAALNHMVPFHEHTAVTHRIRHGLIKLLYVAPETLLRPETLMLLEQARLACLAIDEAHCISEWGHDFRPEYRQLQEVRRRFPHAVCLALTATATRRVREEIRRLLGIATEGEFVASFNRPNLFLAVEPRHDASAQVLAFLEPRRGQAGILYCGTRKQTEELCSALQANGWPALPYHAGLEDTVRHQNQERFLHGEAPLMVATIAFGMGIHKADIRFVVHVQLPQDLESYYQEIGRAGRDGLRAEGLLLYSRSDAMLRRYLIERGTEYERPGREARLQALMRFAETRDCRRKLLLAYFGEQFEQPCDHCDNCVPPVNSAMTDATAGAQAFLSCVRLTGQSFGPAHIIAVLRGSRTKKVLARHHDQLTVFGLGKDQSPEQWGGLAQQFIRRGLLEQDFEFGGLHLTSAGWDVLHGKAKALVATAALAIPERHDSNVLIRPATRHRCQEVGERFAAGQTLEQLAQQFGIQRETVIQNLCRFHEAGGTINPGRLLTASRLPAPERARVLSAFQRLGHERLAPVYEALSGTVSYEELHLLRLYLLLTSS
jgi:ATP-dependent DNA helicase RecQ